MPDHPHGPGKKRARLWLILVALVVLLALIFVPPYISLNHYRSRVTHLVSAALGRPVRMSGVELRILPRPGFLLSDLTVQEDPEYGAEPVLHANEVKASLRFSALWRGKLQISRISVDEASLNLVHMPDGRWNLDSLIRNASAGSRQASGAPPPPYMEATNSRVNIKDGSEKLPFSIVNADASMWRESNGSWRVRLRGQPARTDVSLDLGDTGILRLEATLQPGPQLNQMPLHIDMDWRQAQFGQLSRLVLGSDQGWRGDLTGELHLDGTTSSAKVQSRLRATGVHRAEFAPAEPIDFDANCRFTLEYNHRSLEDLACDSPIGNGRARLIGDVPAGQAPRLTLELNRIPAQAGLDLLRTMRSNIDASLAAAGAVSGRMTYDSTAAPAVPQRHSAHPAPPRSAPNPLSGTFTVSGLSISGNALSHPIQVPELTLTPARLEPGQPVAIAASAAIPAGQPTPLALTARFTLHGFQLGIQGDAAIPRLREFATATGSSMAAALAQISGGRVAVDLNAEGPWVPPAGPPLSVQPSSDPGTVQTSGTASLRDVSWTPSFLPSPVQISSATLHLSPSQFRFDPVAFTYSHVTGTASLDLTPACETSSACPPRFTVHFSQLNTKDLQAALLGSESKGTVFSNLLARFSSSPGWPDVEGTATAELLVLGPFQINDLSADLHIHPDGAEVASFEAGILGGAVHGTASLQAGDKPVYKLDGSFTALSPSDVSRLVGDHWSGGALSGSGSLQLTGYSEKELLDSAAGGFKFDWEHGTVPAAGVPPSFSHFDLWTGDATVSNGKVAISHSQLRRGKRSTDIHAEVTLGAPANISFSTGATPAPPEK